MLAISVPLNALNIRNFIYCVKGFFQKKNSTPTKYKIFPITHTKPASPALNARSKSRIYRQLDARTTQHQQNCDLHIFGIDFFFRPPYIVLAVVNENFFSPLFKNLRKLIQLRFVFKLLFFFGKTNPLFAVSPLLCDWDFQPYVFPICCLKNKSPNLSS